MNTRKRKVLEASLLLFTEKGFQNTSIQDIIKLANISKGTFYNYFSSKNECFLAILENSRYEASIRRHELIEGQDPTDLSILGKQVAVLMQINQEQNLISLFEGVFQSHDPELKTYLAQHRLHEVQWLMSRLIDVYGEEARPYAYEAAVIFFALMQHLSMTYRSVYGIAIDVTLLVNGSLQHIKAILFSMIDRQEVMINADAIQLLEANLMTQEISPDTVITRLEGFYERLSQEPNMTGEQFTTTLLEELKRPQPRYAIIEVLVKPFRESFKETIHEVESRELAHMIWTFVTQLKKDGVQV